MDEVEMSMVKYDDSQHQHPDELEDDREVTVVEETEVNVVDAVGSNSNESQTIVFR